MAKPREFDILFRCGGSELLRIGRAVRRHEWNMYEPDAGTFTRADATTCASLVDATGQFRTAAAGRLRASWTDTNSDGVMDMPGILLEQARTNCSKYSDSFAGAAWVVTGTPTRVAAAATCGAVVLDLIGDDDAVIQEFYTQLIAFTGDGIKSLSVFVKKGTIIPATGCRLQINDSTAVADRLFALVTWSGTVPSVAVSTGTLLRTVRLAGDVYRLEFQTTTVVAANTNRLNVLPASTAAQQGDIYVGGVQCEDAPYPTTYIKTTSAVVARAADALAVPIGFPPQALTVYAQVLRPSWADAPGTLPDIPFLMDIGNTGVGLQIYGDPNTRKWAAQIVNGAGTQQNVAIPSGATLDLCVQFAALTTGGTIRMDTGSGFGAASAVALPLTAWAFNVLTVGGGYGSSTRQLNGAIIELIVAAGLFTLAEMQAV